MARLKDAYNTTFKAKLQKELGIENVMAIPKITKIVVNMGVGEASQNAKLLDGAVADMTAITGQKPVITKSRKSIANFKLRENMGVGCRVTLRGDQMWEFLDRLVNIALPRIRDFKGISEKAFDGRGNYTLGLKEQIIFPEIEYDKVDKVRGMDITICTTATNNADGLALLKQFSMPFRNQVQEQN
ncbi:MAG: 50S ribosomal protein L5 [Zetaproteobacteria bacterium CG06_land_8_20_14_3_00_59_53]|nr:MAG: 50S ribosomal protein L5 [Zetaproteobacteria bacterium CG2_30_59_37]PIO90373.1 MAG: 50S ribosomal protein L5 [Zetaproteobacteria bacterium CG23_combo_of_CG06-09_8_20_14_all_59_86]PIQ65061.1 MAG: 50S ribosomal protein L5 [Zetaproteobacteria bacterium CG11_big_fil_rev_8_21_14_0_20_59_439]PIU70187.1 MAG: 50S ribosomal protein L5 [Zetaproteobacteria bacterium CG06_land_8_20_14_3_00_59_53]PIU96158.1 MAG: 50S ribosomal protein L5 [Zetaproteobacteria bacterium CG03_land_8_20_14_0_80_59_51]PIY